MAKFPVYIQYASGEVEQIRSPAKLPYGLMFTVLTDEQAREYEVELKEKKRMAAATELNQAVEEARAALLRAMDIANTYEMEFYFDIANEGRQRYVGAPGAPHWVSSSGSCGWTNPGEQASGWVNSSYNC